MELLPSSHEEFSQPGYWDKFFKKRGNIPFEWYGEYPELHDVIHKYIMPANQVLVIGCGNSALSENMYDNGLQNLVNIDISDVVIRQMVDRHKDKRPKMTFETMDVTQMSCSDGQFAVALDKGTLDALLVSEEADVIRNVRKMFDEVCRTLKLGGRYIIISLLQDHVQKTLLNYFTELRWPIRIHKINMENQDSDKATSPLPVFAAVITKLKVLPNLPHIVEVVRFEDQIDRLEDVKYLPGILKDIQYYNTIRHQLKKSTPGREQVSLELHTKGIDTPRYKLIVVDSETVMKNKFAIFIVPQGREHEWIFSTDKGRTHLVESAQFQRLVIVSLSRGHDYENLEAIKAELSGKVMELAPKDHPCKKQTPFLTIGEDIGKRMPVAKGHSDTTGHYLVEDVEINGGQVFRRLVFLSNSNVIQSEARMVEIRPIKRRGKKPREGMPTGLKVDKGYMPSDYLIVMLGGLAFLPSIDESLNGVIVGLGGGGLSSFLHGAFPRMVLNSIELDPTVVDIAKNWFGLEEDGERLRIHVADGIKYIQDCVVSGSKLDFVVVDTDSKLNTTGLVCPAPPFIEPAFLHTVRSILSDHGVFILNLASRDEDLKNQILERISGVFSSCASLQLQEDINCVVFASNQSQSHPDLDMDRLRHMFFVIDKKIKSTWKTTNVELPDMMEELAFCDF